jgi:hypothetical protein
VLAPFRLKLICLIVVTSAIRPALAHEVDSVFDDSLMYGPIESFWAQPEHVNDDETGEAEHFEIFSCKPASVAQIAEVNTGNTKLNDFLSTCASKTNGSSWCQQVVRPNPSSIATFRCTYGPNQPHTLIHPNVKTWSHAIDAVLAVEDLESAGIKVCEIYNWWRPEPYNENVGGAPGRHPFGTSVDVRFCSKADMEKAFLQACKWRAQGLIRAVGYYGSTGLHVGVGDAAGNTWGKACPP